MTNADCTITPGSGGERYLHGLHIWLQSNHVSATAFMFVCPCSHKHFRIKERLHSKCLYLHSPLYAAFLLVWCSSGCRLAMLINSLLLSSVSPSFYCAASFLHRSQVMSSCRPRCFISGGRTCLTLSTSNKQPEGDLIVQNSC